VYAFDRPAGATCRRLAVLGLAVGATLLVAPAGANADSPQRGGATCTVTPLPVPDGTLHSQVIGGDPTGRYLVGDADIAVNGQEGTHLLRWVDGAVSEFRTPYQGATSADVNRRGVIVGQRMDQVTFHTDAWKYEDGRFTVLPGLKPTDSTTAAAINSRGDVTGVSLDETVFPAAFHAVIWPAGHPRQVRELPADPQIPGGAKATDIDDDGTVVGYLGSIPGAATAYVWPARGGAHALPVRADAADSAAYAVRDGWVAGTTLLSGHSIAVRWNLRTGGFEVLSNAAGYGTTRAVNGQGTVATVGALVHRDGRVVPLPTNGGWAWPNVLTDRGTAAGSSDVGFSSFSQAVSWTGC
jgi:uncharacterized membrane protein